ncbi:MAG: sigma-70 family RNA polymerase sigma factor, partial [Ilumatobacter sp.]|nr:sigma-70 family RNA polymerase sigma factor [Ilumatobacter sp.]
MTTIDLGTTTGGTHGDTPAHDRSSAARTTATRRFGGDVSDAEILDAVRRGDQQAFDQLYRRHQPAVRRLARRLARSAADVDDIVSEVFAATLRATLAGRGPTDDAEPYLLRSVRNTATSWATRGDGRRVRATDDDTLADLTADRSVDVALSDEEVTEAFRDLPERFRDVLWSTEIEGATPADLADGDTDAGAVASLSHRARCALRRSYLSVSTRRRCTDAACRSVRSAMPAVVLGGAATSTVARVDRHVISCSECAAVFDQMHHLAEHMPSRSLLALVLAFVRNFGGVGASLIGGAAPVIVIPAAVATITAGAIVATDLVDRDGRPASTATPVERVLEPPAEPTATTTGRASEAAPSTAARAAAATTGTTDAVATPAAPTPASTTGTKTAHEPIAPLVGTPPAVGGPLAPVGHGAPGTDDTVDVIVDEVLPDEASGPLDATLTAIDDTVGTLTDDIDRTVTDLADDVDEVLRPVTSLVD